MFNARSLLLVTIALILAFAAVFVARRIITSRQAAAPVERPVDTVPVVQANQTIPYLSKVTESAVRIIQVPKGALPPESALPGGGFDYFTDTTQVVGKFVTQTVYAGEFMHKQRLREDLGGAPLAHDVRPGLRAVTIRANEIVGVGGFVVPDSRVDVLIVHKQGDRAHIGDEDVLQDIEVAAVDQEASSDKDKPSVVRSITLIMNPEQARRVAEGQEDGTVQLALRNPVDRAIAPGMRTARDTKPASATPPHTTVTLLKRGARVTYRCQAGACQAERAPATGIAPAPQ